MSNGNNYNMAEVFGTHSNPSIDILLTTIGKLKQEAIECDKFWQEEILRYKAKVAELYEWKQNMLEFNGVEEQEPNPVPREDGHLPHPDEWSDFQLDSDEELDTDNEPE